MPKIPARVALTAVVSVLTLPAFAEAQYRLPIGGPGPSVHLELAKPFFEDQGFGPGFGATTAMLDATVVVPLEGGPTLFGRIGFTRATIEGLDVSTLLTNPRVGVLFAGEGATHGELHVDLPLAWESDDDYATGVAFASDPERVSRFNPNAWSIGGTITPQSELESGATLGARVGAEVWIPTESGPDTELIGIYAGFGRIPLGAAFVEGEVSGIAILTQDELSFGERTLFTGTVTVGLPEVGGAPELFVRLPLDEDTRDLPVDAVVGVRVRLGG